MADAPKETPPSELWLKLSQSKRPSKEIDFPRKDPTTGESIGKLAMWPLTQGEIIVAQAKALEFAQGLVKSSPELAGRIENTPVFNNAVACEILYRACRRIEAPEHPVWPTVKEIRDQHRGLTSDECAVLMNAYSFVQLELGPIAAHMSLVEQEALIKRLQEGGSAIPLASLSLDQWSDLTLYMASQLATLRTLKSSAGSQLDYPTLNANDAHE